MAYKERVPVCGAVLISEYWDKVCVYHFYCSKIGSLTRYDLIGTFGEGMEQRSFLVFSSREDK